MSANGNNEDKNYSTSSSLSEGRNSRMEFAASRYPNRGMMGEPISEPAGLARSTLPLRPIALPAPRNEGLDRWGSSVIPSRPGSQEGNRLPSIRDVIPEEFQGGFPENDVNSLNIGVRSHYNRPLQLYTPPEQASSPPSSSKRRRLSLDDDDSLEARDYSVPRSYRNSPRMPHYPSLGDISPASSARRGSTFSTRETWAGSARTSPYIGARRLPPMIEPQQSYEPSGMGRSTWRPDLPNLPLLSSARATPPFGRPHSHEYSLDSSRSSIQPWNRRSSIFEPPESPQYPPQSPQYPSPPAVTSYGYHPPRGQSYSGPSGYSPTQDRSTFSANSHYGPHHRPGFSIYAPTDGSEGPSDSKQRRRRGNLPKETTEKLRTWFHANLQHPYPTEDQKQELMRATGLQMNQISNWFINARRRQLPAMMNDARAELSATSATSGRQVQGETSSDLGDSRRGSGGSEGSVNGFVEPTERKRVRESI